jgi:hypothetical protein
MLRRSGLNVGANAGKQTLGFTLQGSMNRGQMQSAAYEASKATTGLSRRR